MAELGPEALYSQLGHHISSVPNLANMDRPEVMHWLGRAFALVSATGDGSAANRVKVLHEFLRVHMAPTSDVRTFATLNQKIMEIMDILYRALAVAELNAPAASQGAFIPAGAAFDAMAAVGKVLQRAKADALIVDPYMDEKVLTDFVGLAAPKVSIRLLADQADHKATLRPAATRWVSQHGTERPLAVRLAPARRLHDRLITIDNTEAWTLTQSLNAFAGRSPASIIRVDSETAARKVAAYEAIWQSATPV